MNEWEQPSRRDFLQRTVAAAIAATVPMPVQKVLENGKRIYPDCQIRCGLLQEPLLPGGQARVFQPNPYYPGCGGVHIVHAGRFVNEQPLPIGHPVMFIAIEGKGNVQIG